MTSPLSRRQAVLLDGGPLSITCAVTDEENTGGGEAGGEEVTEPKSQDAEPEAEGEGCAIAAGPRRAVPSLLLALLVFGAMRRRSNAVAL